MATVGGPHPVLMGDCIVSADPHVSLVTLLGSCVAACIWDPHAKVGGMNHFLVPGAKAFEGTTRPECRGSVLMERLLHSVLSHGAAQARLEARIFGGASVIGNALRIGSRNIECATDFLAAREIALCQSDVGGRCARRLLFWPASGRIEVRRLYAGY